MSDTTKGILFLTASALGFAVMSIFVKLSGDLPTIQKVWFRNAITVITSTILIIHNKGLFFGLKENRKWLVLRSALGTTGMILFFYAMDNMILSDANMLNKLSTFFLILFSIIFLKEHVKRYQVIAITIAFLGSLFIIKPAFQVVILPYLASIGAAMCAGGAYTILRFLGNKESFYTITFFFSLFSVLVIVPFLFIYFTPMSNLQLLYLVLAGGFASIGQFGITIAYRYAPAREISIFNYFNVVFVTILSYLVFMDYPDIFSVIGYIVIFSASVYIFTKNKQKTQTQI